MDGSSRRLPSRLNPRCQDGDAPRRLWVNSSVATGKRASGLSHRPSLAVPPPALAVMDHSSPSDATSTATASATSEKVWSRASASEETVMVLARYPIQTGGFRVFRSNLMRPSEFQWKRRIASPVSSISPLAVSRGLS
jgi:hypothetical protein